MTSHHTAKTRRRSGSGSRTTPRRRLLNVGNEPEATENDLDNFMEELMRVSDSHSNRIVPFATSRKTISRRRARESFHQLSNPAQECNVLHPQCSQTPNTRTDDDRLQDAPQSNSTTRGLPVAHATSSTPIDTTANGDGNYTPIRQGPCRRLATFSSRRGAVTASAPSSDSQVTTSAATNDGNVIDDPFLSPSFPPLSNHVTGNDSEDPNPVNQVQDNNIPESVRNNLRERCFPEIREASQLEAENGVDDNTISNFSDDESSLLPTDIETLSDMQQRQRLMLIAQNRRADRTAQNVAINMRGRRNSTRFNFDTRSAEPKYLWESEIRKVINEDKEFFKNREALMLCETRVSKGVTSYKGVSVYPENCLDINTVYKDNYLCQDVFQGNANVNKDLPFKSTYSESFKQLLSVMGQFVRWCIVQKEIPVFEGWKQNAIFRALSNELLVQTFIEYFRIRGSASTVNTKTIHLRTMIRSALKRCGNDLQRRDGLKVVYHYLQKSGNACKKIGRSKRTMRSVAQSRAAEGKLLLVDDFTRCILEARTALDQILESVEESRDDNIRRRRMNPASALPSNLLKKWCINFTALIIFLAGGQRPQVFGQLQCPTEEELDLWSSSSYTSSYIELETVHEKRVRTTELPNAIIPKLILRYLKFQVNTAREQILTNHGIRETQHDRPLLIHTESGQYFETNNVLATLRAFVTRIDPDLRHITTMSLRASYATVMFRAHRAKEIFPNLNEDMFLQELGKMMNTSIEQLKQTYISSDTSDFHETANEVASFLAGIGLQDDHHEFEEMNQEVDRFRKEKELRRIFS